MTCESSKDPGVCHHVAVDAQDIRDNGTVAFLSLRASSWPARFTLWAEQVTYKEELVDSVYSSQEMVPCSLVTFELPKGGDVAGAVIRAGTVIQAGSNSPDGKLLFRSKIESGASSFYVYELVN